LQNLQDPLILLAHLLHPKAPLVRLLGLLVPADLED
jgi:hypothetical protein